MKIKRSVSAAIFLAVISIAQADSPKKSKPGSYVCNIVYDNATALETEMNAVCNSAKPFSLSTAIRSTGSIAMTYCCVVK